VFKHLVQELKSWTRLKHPNILELYGVSRGDPWTLTLVSPWMEDGDLLRYLRDHPNSHRAVLIQDILQGLHYMHTELNPPIAHGDLKANNILVRASGRACLADFGLSRIQEESSESHTSTSRSATTGNVRWKPPEWFFPERYGLTFVQTFTPEADIYSFGMVIYEVYTEMKPFAAISNRYEISTLVAEGQRPPRPEPQNHGTGMSPAMWGIVEDCWRGARYERPS
ncbi:kinase-like protein, partial [Calocera cornea HHB12733]